MLTAVVKFCLTDEVLHFDCRGDEEAARGMVQLVACADYLNMPLLQDKARALAESLLEVEKSFACAMFEEASLLGTPTASVKLEALDIVRRSPEDTLLSTPSVSCVGPGALAEIIRDNEMGCDEITIFRALHKWATTDADGGVLDLHTAGDRASAAKSLAATHIRYSSIRPSDLASNIAESGLVDKAMISEAFREQALFVGMPRELDLRCSKKRKTWVPSITVAGAGISAVNGVYHEDGKHEGFPKFTKKCSWQGVGRTLVIYRHDYFGGGRNWFIAIVGEYDKSIGGYMNDFYLGGDQGGVPSDGWRVRHLGKEPCPKCKRR